MPEQETRITDPVTGGQKGQKAAQLGALDPQSLLAVARVAGFGAEKYDRFNFARGYDWSLSFDAMQRHLLLWADGQDLDDESGEPHLAHAAWHCLALLTFSQRGRGTDDRIDKFLAGLKPEERHVGINSDLFPTWAGTYPLLADRGDGVVEIEHPRLGRGIFHSGEWEWVDPRI